MNKALLSVTEGLLLMPDETDARCVYVYDFQKPFNTWCLKRLNALSRVDLGLPMVKEPAL